ncbi:LysM domain-containing protein [Colletotrichum tabaci]|uniref:LysM domain-containing protein n=1 Tax=Colletotrichum tabaci TaxID=1209068 RepID=A0AAV9T557_9PEZI
MAIIYKAAGVAGLAVLLPSVLAQQFTGAVFPYDYFNLSLPCFEALNTTLIDVLDPEGIAAICTDSCRKSMQSLRYKIENDCDPTSDLLDHGLNMFPATHIVDRYVYAYEVSCYKNRDTGDFCDYILGQWRNQTDDAPHDCDDCVLGPMEIEVNSEIGHTKDRSAEFQSAISSCSKTGYTYVEPSIHSSTSAASAEPTIVAADWSAHRMSSNCASTYHVQEGDTCESISADQNVSTKGLIEGNDVLNGWCSGLVAGQDLCMPEQCKVHFVEPDDSCESLADKYGATPKDLVEWNPLMYIQCDDFVYSKPTYICVGKPKKGPQVPWSQKQLHIPRFDD